MLSVIDLMILEQLEKEFYNLAKEMDDEQE